MSTKKPLLGYQPVQFDRSLLTFPKNVLPPSSGYKSKLRMEKLVDIRRSTRIGALSEPIGVRRRVNEYGALKKVVLQG
jgi:hypothetical protein